MLVLVTKEHLVVLMRVPAVPIRNTGDICSYPRNDRRIHWRRDRYPSRGFVTEDAQRYFVGAARAWSWIEEGAAPQS